MNTMDCTDIKALLSGLVDDELDSGTRHTAERHLADCTACRELVNEAEKLNQLIVADTMIELDARLADSVIGGVLGRTVYAGMPRASTAAGWVNRLGWIAAAACLALAVTLWVMNQSTTDSTESPIVLGGEADRVVETTTPAVHFASLPRESLRSSTYDGDLINPANVESDSEKAPGARDMMPLQWNGMSRSTSAVLSQEMSSPIDERDTAVALRLTDDPLISREDAETIDAAAVLIDMMVASDSRSFAGVEDVRQIAEYDELLTRLAEARSRLPIEDHAAVLAAESVLLRIIHGPLSLDDLSDLRESAIRSRVSDQLSAISDRYYRTISL